MKPDTNATAKTCLTLGELHAWAGEMLETHGDVDTVYVALPASHHGWVLVGVREGRVYATPGQMALAVLCVEMPGQVHKHAGGQQPSAAAADGDHGGVVVV